MLMNANLKKLCEAILNDSIGSENFGNLIVQAGIRLDEKEWDIANDLLKKSDEINHAAGGKENRKVH
jgi:hypothetical protein